MAEKSRIDEMDMPLGSGAAKSALEEYGYDTFRTMLGAYSKYHDLFLLRRKTVKRGYFPKLKEFDRFHAVTNDLEHILNISEDKARFEKLISSEISKSNEHKKTFWRDEYAYFNGLERVVSDSGAYTQFCDFLLRIRKESQKIRKTCSTAFMDADMNLYLYTFALFMFFKEAARLAMSDALRTSIYRHLNEYINKPNKDEATLRAELYRHADMMDLPALFGSICYTLKSGPIGYGEMHWLNGLSSLIRQGISESTIEDIIKKKAFFNGFSKQLPKKYDDLCAAEISILSENAESGLYTIGEVAVSSYSGGYLREVRMNNLYFLDGKLMHPVTQDHEFALLYYRAVKEEIYDKIRKSALEVLCPSTLINRF